MNEIETVSSNKLQASTGAGYTYIIVFIWHLVLRGLRIDNETQSCSDWTGFFPPHTFSPL